MRFGQVAIRVAGATLASLFSLVLMSVAIHFFGRLGIPVDTELRRIIATLVVIIWLGLFNK